MACSRFEYVKHFENHDKLLLGCWAIIRLDGRSFTKFAKKHEFRKPNDIRALNLCNYAAQQVLCTFDDHLICAYGESDEFSFVLKRQSSLFARRSSKILSTIVSLFTSAYVYGWSRFMEGIELKEPPSFDGRIVLYPTTKHLRDYLSWRQADVHVNNLFNTVFWALVDRGGKSPKEAEATLKGTLSKDKHEILFTQFNINYNNEPQIFRKGSFIVKNPKLTEPTDRMDSKRRRLDESTAVSNDQGISPSEVVPVDEESKFLVLHVDIIEDKFWAEHPHLLAPSDLEPPRIRKT